MARGASPAAWTCARGGRTGPSLKTCGRGQKLSAAAGASGEGGLLSEASQQERPTSRPSTDAAVAAKRLVESQASRYSNAARRPPPATAAAAAGGSRGEPAEITLSTGNNDTKKKQGVSSSGNSATGIHTGSDDDEGRSGRSVSSGAADIRESAHLKLRTMHLGKPNSGGDGRDDSDEAAASKLLKAQAEAQAELAARVDVGENEMLHNMWKKEMLLSQELDATDVLRRKEQTFAEVLTSFTMITKFNHWEVIPRQRLLDVLEGYHPEVRSLCGYKPDRPAGETLSSLKDMLEWFRKKFPYYDNECHTCGNREDNTFVGCVHPTRDERAFRALRTEMYHCSACGAISRFPRYTVISKVLETQRGRCREYSVLMLRLLEALGYTCRWVVDWSDHVWVEARVGERWVHIDPCEAAVDEPLLYESWGKNQTYVLAFSRQEVVDVTDKYTSDFEAAKARRNIDQGLITALIADATKTLQDP